MDYSNLLRISYYKVIATIHKEHNVFLVQHIETNKIYIEKILDVFNIQIYEYLFQHPIAGTPRIIDYCQMDNQLILIEEYISGITLEEYIESHKLDDNLIAYYIYTLCHIVNQLHTCTPAIIHRDIKPSNCIINYSNQLILLDFNAAKQESDKKQDTVLLGTQGYASPEQYGFGASTCQSDIYSIGITCKEMVQSLSNPCHDFDFIINKCTQLDPKMRYSSVNDLQEAILSLYKIDGIKATRATKYLPPGYRTRTPWKITIATAFYTMVILLTLALEVKQPSSLFETVIFKISFLLAVVLCVFISFNYRNIQRYLPLCSSKNKILHYLGILLFDILIIILCALI